MNLKIKLPRSLFAAAPLACLSLVVLAGCNGHDSTANPTPGPVASDASGTPKASPVAADASGTTTPLPAAGAGATATTKSTPAEVPGGPGGTMMNKPSKNPAGALGDAEITLRVKNILIADTNVAARTINVDTKSQVVVLRGRQKSPAQITAAINDAKQIKGVTQVISQLTVAP